MTTSLLRLDSFFVESLAVEANRGLRPGKVYDERLAVRVEQGQRHDASDDGVNVVVRLRINLNSPPKPKKRWRYRIRMLIGGKFVVLPDTPPQTADSLITYNAPSILWGLARGILSGLTGNFPHGRFLLPTMDFIALISAARQIASPRTKAAATKPKKKVRKRAAKRPRRTKRKRT